MLEAEPDAAREDTLYTTHAWHWFRLETLNRTRQTAPTYAKQLERPGTRMEVGGEEV